MRNWALPVATLVIGLSACDDVTDPERNLTLDLPGPLVLEALGDTVRLNPAADPGFFDIPPVITFASSDSTVVEVSPSGLIRATGNGSAWVTAFDYSGAGDSVLVSVNQTLDSIHVELPDSLPIVSLGSGAVLPATCAAVDRNGFPLPGAPLVVSATGTVTGNSCETLVAVKSGHDTLTITSGGRSVVLPLALAVIPQVTTPVGEFAPLDSFPFDYRLWAPSARLNSQGQVEVYVTGYQYVTDSNGVGPGALHRLISNDGVSFQYDGIALDLPPPPCGLICTGIENIAIIPRSGSAGWRMLFAAGSSGTYGWQVFSAVSSDERSWTIEPGVRISNGGTVPPAQPMTPPWPVGEGIVIDRLPDGTWRMVVGGYEPVPGAAAKFQVLEYRSTDQLLWTYRAALFTTSQMPPNAQRSVYSPTLTEFAPGLWRMFVTADDLHLPGGRSRIYTAVSTDRTTWQFETQLIGGPGTNIYYSALVNDRLYFIRQDDGQLRRLAAVTVTMP